MDHNPFHEPNNGYLGDFVKMTNGTGFTGRVYNCHFTCPENDDWLAGQLFLGQDPFEYRQVRWVSILVHNGGAVTVPDTMVEVVKPFLLNNNSSGMYFPLNERA